MFITDLNEIYSFIFQLIFALETINFIHRYFEK